MTVTIISSVLCFFLGCTIGIIIMAFVQAGKSADADMGEMWERGE